MIYLWLMRHIPWPFGPPRWVTDGVVRLVLSGAGDEEEPW